MANTAQNNMVTGASYFIRGINLLLHPALRAYILVPLSINIVLFVVLTAVLVHYFGVVMESITFDPPSWLPFAEILFDIATVLLGIVLGVLVLIVYGYSFNVITNIIAGPFYGLLSEKTEYLLKGSGPPPEKLIKMVPRVVLRELAKLLYFLTRGVVVILVILLIGAVQMVVHMVYFLHMSPRSEGGWTLLALIFTVIIVAIALAGSLWVMYHLNVNMMPGHLHDMPSM